MDRAVRRLVRIIALLASLALVPGCKGQLEKHAPALARANFNVERIAVAGVVSNQGSLKDPPESRERWSVLVAEHLGQERFGSYPIVSSAEVQTLLGSERYGAMLDRFKADGQCEQQSLAELQRALEGKARFVLFMSILSDGVMEGEAEVEDAVLKTKTKTKSSTRTSWVRLHVYDLTNQQLAWNHRDFGVASSRESRDITDVIKHNSEEGILSALGKSIVNSTLKPDPKMPTAPALDITLGKAIDRVGKHMRPRR